MSVHDFVARHYPGYESQPLSDSNNPVLRVASSNGPIVVKEIIDRDIPACYMFEVNNALAPTLRVQRTLELHYVHDQAPIVVSEFVDGQPLSDTIQGLPPEAACSIASDLLAFSEACADLPRLRGRFGLYKVSAPMFDTLAEFLESYGRKYWSRVRKILPSSESTGWVDHWLDTRIDEAAVGDSPRTIAIDANLRNFVQLADNSLYLLNVPIVGLSTRAHAAAALSVHLRYTPVFDAFGERSVAGFSAAEQRACLQLELWQLLGIMSFYAVRAPDSCNDWRNWGSPVTLVDHLHDLIAHLRRI